LTKFVILVLKSGYKYFSQSTHPLVTCNISEVHERIIDLVDRSTCEAVYELFLRH